ncbi:LysR substrate-binding domain-containing protein [Pseudonocardia sp. GCM10023141]|uniref:LysR substrate-binding domain-containing protein n=1 Tax=Pseudonocardia sp. GCM10023141 TaxID=3252653 RepID=UPI00361FE00F
MELRHLRSFTVLAEQLNFNRAAELLHLTQPSLTQQIKRLERDVGVVLFERTTRKVELTSAGREFLDRARSILASVDDAVVAAERASRGELGRLAVGFTGTSTYELLPIVTREFRAEAPDVELVLQGEMLTPDLVTALLTRTLDVAFLRPPVTAPDLELRVLRRESLGVLLPERHRLCQQAEIDLSDLAEEQFITHPANVGGAMFSITLKACLDAGFRPKVVQQASETAVIASLVAAGVGVALLPLSVRYIHVTGAVLRPLTPSDTQIELAVAWLRGRPSPVVTRFLKTAERIFEARSAPDRGLRRS